MGSVLGECWKCAGCLGFTGHGCTRNVREMCSRNVLEMRGCPAWAGWPGRVPEMCPACARTSGVPGTGGVAGDCLRNVREMF